MSKPLSFDTYSTAFPKATTKPTHAFHGLSLSLTAEPVSLTLTDAGLLAEPWEAIEIDEQAPAVAPPARVVRPYRLMLAAFKARHLLA